MSIRNARQLPLLVAFDAIMTRGSLVEAAEAMNVTQSAVSKQLAQLRVWLDDELFVRTRDGMQPTPRALALREQVEAILEQATALGAPARVSPESFTGSFRLSATDEVLERILPALMPRIAAEAPQLRLVTVPITPDYRVRELEAGQVQLVVAVNWHAPGQLKQKRLGEDPFVCLMHEDHPLARSRLTLQRFAGADHALVAPLGFERGVVDGELERHGLARHVSVSVPHFGLVNEALLGARRIVTLPSRVAEALASRGPFVTRRVPLELPLTVYYALWHPRFAGEPRLRWVIDIVEAVYADV